MPLFRYIAASPGNIPAPGDTPVAVPGGALRRRGELVAESAEQVRAALRASGLAPVRIREIVESSRSDGQSDGRAALGIIRGPLGRRRRSAALVEVYERLAMMLASGVELSAALESLSAGRADGARSSSSRLCAALTESVRRGSSLAESMGERPDWFGPVDCALVRAAEESGALERALADLANRGTREDELRGRLTMALAYPAILTLFGAGVVVFLTTTTLPQLAAVLRDAGADIPTPTAALLRLGELIRFGWWAALPALAIAGALLVRGMRSEAGARARLRTPLLGPAIARAQLGSASILLARLLDAGAPLTECLSLVSATLPNAALRREVESLAASITRGVALADAPPAGSALDPVFWSALRMGEESGELAECLRRVGERMLRSSRRLTDKLAAALEPIVILLLAAGVGFVVYAAIAPMLRLTQTLGS